MEGFGREVKWARACANVKVWLRCINLDLSVPQWQQPALAASGKTNGFELVMSETKEKKQRTVLGFIYEFLVIFIAVILGYLADNYREELADREKEQQYATNLVRDLKKDSVRLTELISLNRTKKIKLDSFVMLSHFDFKKPDNLKLFYTKAEDTKMPLTYIFRSNQATLYQLKSTGDLRLMKKQNVAGKIAEYDLSVQYLQESEQYYISHTEETWRIMYQLTTDLNAAVQWDRDSYVPPPLYEDVKKLQLFFNLTQDLSWTIDGYIDKLEEQRKIASDLLDLLRKTYD